MDYPSNSISSREKKRKQLETGQVSKVVKGGVKTHKRSRLAELFLPEDMKSVRDYIVEDIVVPTIKKGLSDAFDIFLFGESSRGRRGSSGDRRSLRSMFDNNFERRDSRASSRRTSTAFTEEIIFDDRYDAELVLNKMEETIAQYGVVTILNFYDFVGLTNCPHTGNDYGWDNLDSARVEHCGDGFIIRFPRVKYLD